MFKGAKKTMLSRHSASRLNAMANKADREPRRSPESDAQITVFQILRLNERRHPELAFVFAVPNGGRRDAATAGRLKAEGVKAGVVDICIPISRYGYGAAWIEMKAGNNKCTPEQVRFLEFVGTQNHATKICYTADQACEFVEFYLGIELTR